MQPQSGERPDYKDNADAYELEERARPDEMLMLYVAGALATNHLNFTKGARVVDFCCGTGLSLEALVENQNVSTLIGVDISTEYLAFCRNKYQHCRNVPALICGDAIEAPLPGGEFDLVMMASAYHHIEDARKVSFLRRVKQLLSRRGVAVVAENILPEYRSDDRTDYARAVRMFYTEVLETALRANPSIDDYIRALIERVAEYGCDGDYEYKVDYPTFRRDIEAAGLVIRKELRVWPDTGQLRSTLGGNYVLELVGS